MLHHHVSANVGFILGTSAGVDLPAGLREGLATLVFPFRLCPFLTIHPTWLPFLPGLSHRDFPTNK